MWTFILLLIAGLIFWSLARGNARNCAPIVPGLGPILGNTLQIALHGSQFLHQSRNKASRKDAFVVNLAGKRMVFLFHPAAIHIFFTAPDDLIAFR